MLVAPSPAEEELAFEVRSQRLVISAEELFVARRRRSDLVFGSFGRSAALTAGSRWRVLALLAIVFEIQIGVWLLTEFIASLAGDGRVAVALAAAFSAGFSAILLATVLGSLYVEARNVKEGRGVSGLESTFQ